MSILIDSNIIIDVISVDERFAGSSSSALDRLVRQDRLIVNEVIFSEIAHRVERETTLRAILAELLVGTESLTWSAAFLAGLAHARYRKAGGTRERTLPDFLIGAHAQTGGHTLLTRDPDRYRSYFPELAILTPEGVA
jgi:predicted nucleic acid-binding protein